MEGRETTAECGACCDIVGWAAVTRAGCGVGTLAAGRGVGARPPYTSAPRAPRLLAGHADTKTMRMLFQHQFPTINMIPLVLLIKIVGVIPHL